MKRNHLLALGVAVLAALTLTVAAFAGNAHFVGTPTLTIDGNSIIVEGKVAGLGNIPQIHVDVTADAQCVNPGTKKPKASNKQSIGAGEDVPVQNGKANFSVTATATFQPDCTPPMSLEFSNITVIITDDDGNVLLQQSF